MACGPITSWQIDGETVETVADFIFLTSRITAGGDCSCEIKILMVGFCGRVHLAELTELTKQKIYSSYYVSSRWNAAK